MFWQLFLTWCLWVLSQRDYMARTWQDKLFRTTELLITEYLLQGLLSSVLKVTSSSDFFVGFQLKKAILIEQSNFKQSIHTLFSDMIIIISNGSIFFISIIIICITSILTTRNCRQHNHNHYLFRSRPPHYLRLYYFISSNIIIIIIKRKK